jgi:hypothetical protein
MGKHKKLILLIFLVLFVAAMHFIPIYNQTGVLDRGLMNLCIGYGGPGPDYYRVIPNGTHDFMEDKKIFRSGLDDSCAVPVNLRLYIW